MGLQGRIEVSESVRNSTCCRSGVAGILTPNGRLESPEWTWHWI